MVDFAPPGRSTPGGSNGQIQYNNSGAFGGDSTFYFSGSGATSTVVVNRLSSTGYGRFNNDRAAIGYATNGISVYSGGQFSFSSGADALGSFDVNLVRDAANTLALRNGTNAQSFNVYNTYTDASNYQRVRLTASPFGGGGFGLISEGIGTGSAATTLYLGSTGSLAFRTAGVTSWLIDTSGNLVTNGGTVDIGGSGTSPRNVNVGTSLILGLDVKLNRDAANTLALQNGVNAQAFRVYNTYTDASNYERLILGSTGTLGYVGNEAAGTGVARGIVIGSNPRGNPTATAYLQGTSIQLITSASGLTAWAIQSNGNFFAGTDNTYDIGASGSSRPRNLYVASNIYGSIIQAVNYLQWINGTTIAAPSSGVITLYNNGNTDFGRLQFGGTTASFPALKRNATALESRLADDSAYAPFNAQAFNAYGTYTDAANYERGFFRQPGSILQIGHEAAGTGSARFVQIFQGGSSYLTIGNGLFRLDQTGLIWNTDNAYDIGASGANRPRNVYVAGLIKSGGTIQFGASQIYGGTDTNLQLQGASGSGFNLLQFGGAAASFPALKRSTTTLQARLADDSAFTAIQGKLTTDTAYTAGAPPAATGYVTIYDSTGTAYRVAVVV